MKRFLLRRAIRSLLVLGGILSIVFVVTNLIGDPVRQMVGISGADADYQHLRIVLGYDRPLAERFITFLSNALRGDFGLSLWQQTPALALVLDRLPATLQLCSAAMFLSLAVAVPVGVLAAYKPRSGVDRVSQLLSFIAISVPEFWLGILLILAFAVELRALPAFGYGGWEHLVLPALALAPLSAGRVTQIVRTNVIEELAKPYIDTARSKGLPPVTLVWRHALPNAAIPIITYSGWEFLRMLAGGIVSVEFLFAWPGLGQLAIQAVERSDLPVIEAITVVIAVMVTLLNLAIDLFYVLIDPRVRIQ